MRRRRRRPRELSLAEQMIAMAIGALLFAGMLYVLSNNRASLKAQRTLDQLQDNARRAESTLIRIIAHAKDNSDARFANDQSNRLDDIGASAGTSLTHHTHKRLESDSLRVRTRLARHSACRKNDDASATVSLIDVVLYVDDRHYLMCRCVDMSGAPIGIERAIAYRVDRFKIRYGMDTDAIHGVDRYVDDRAAIPNGVVRSLRIQLLLHSPNNNYRRLDNPKRYFEFADGQIVTADRRRAYVMIDRTVVIGRTASSIKQPVQ